MSATYVTITELEMDNIFKASKDWEKIYVQGTKETVYQKRLKTAPHVVVKVYSSLVNGVSRHCGGDAIRVCAVDIKRDRGLVKTSRINRVGDWEKRLIERVTDVWNKAKIYSKKY